MRGRAPALVVAIHSTVAPTTPGELADAAGRHGVRRGRRAGQRRSHGRRRRHAGDHGRRLATRPSRRCAEPFALMGSEVVHAGPVGAGTRMKLARNLLHFVSFTAATEAQRLAEAAGLDLVALGEVVRHTDAITGGPGAIMHRDTTAPLDPDDFWFGVFEHVRGPGREGPAASRSSWPTSSGSTYRWRGSRASDLGPGLGLPRRRGTHDRRSSTDCPSAARGLDKMERGLRLRDAGRRRATSSATPPTTSSPTSGTGPGSPTATAGCC